MNPPRAAAAVAAESLTESATSIWNTFLESLPRVGIAVVVVALSWLVGKWVRAGSKRFFARSRPESFSRVMSKMLGWIVVAVGVLLGATIVFPSVAPVDLLAGLGFFSVAIGFAFKDILENLLAGVLLLFREPFHAGDQVEVAGGLGTVEQITIRETRLRTFDGQRVLIPNSDVYKNAIRVQTAFDKRRLEVMVGVAYEADLSEARSTIEHAMIGVEGVSTDPAPEALLERLGSATIDFRARFWCDPRQLESLVVQDRVIEAIKVALDDAKIEMPSDIIALQATSSFAAAIQGGRVTPGGSVEADEED